MTKAIFIPGNHGGSVKDNWFPYVKKELRKIKVEVIAKDFPDSELAREKYWLPFIKNELEADENTFLIGHSSGSIAAMRYAENYQILGSVLVASYYTDLGDKDEAKSGYFDKPWNWDSIKNNQKFIIQFASTDDPWIPIQEPELIHNQLNSDYFEYNDQGHFGGGGRDKSEFPELIKALKNHL